MSTCACLCLLTWIGLSHTINQWRQQSEAESDGCTVHAQSERCSPSSVCFKLFMSLNLERDHGNTRVAPCATYCGTVGGAVPFLRVLLASASAWLREEERRRSVTSVGL